MTASSLSPQDWEALIENYNRNGAPNNGAAAAAAVVEQSLTSLLRKDLPHLLKIHLLIFLEQHSLSLFASPNSSSLTRLLEALRHHIQSPNPSDLKEQFLISATSVFIAVPDPDLPALEGLVELLVTVVNRPNHGVDRQTRAVACECLRELEIAHPCLLSEAVAHIWGLCQTERTHASQSYVLLLATVLYNIVNCRPSLSNLTILSASAPLVPFSVPRFVLDGEDGVCDTSLQQAGLHKELRRAISFLLEWPQYFTPLGTMEFMRMTIPMAKALELQPSLLKVQFSGLVYTYDPLLSHAYLGIYLEFLDSFDGEELGIADRLVLQTKECSQNDVFRLLALHWLLGLIRLVVHRDARKKRDVVDRSLSFYPAIFDSLALKSLKLDLVAYCAVLHNDKKNTNGAMMDAASEAFVSKLLIDGLTCVSSFKWLPPWSTETLVAFRTFHKFLVGASFSNESDPPSDNYIIQSSIFHTLQGVLVESILNYEGLVLLIVSFVDRFLECSKHYWLGEWLLETLNISFLPKLKIDYTLGSYFPILERIADNKVPPSGLIELLSNFILFLIEKHGPETGLKSWSLGSKLLGICRTMLIHHHSSSLFIGLSHLLAFTCLSFPDLEVRDHARTYLRMLVCIPGKKLRNLLNMGEELPGIGPSTHSSSFQNHQLPLYHDLKKSEGISSYIHLERSVPLFVRQSWSLTLPDLSFVSEEPLLQRDVVINEITSEPDEDDGASSGAFSDVKRIGHLQEPLRVMDTKDSAIVGILRKHFSSVPDLRYSRGFKVKIPCTLCFDAELFNQSADTSQSSKDLDEVDSLPAIYATVLKFSSSAPYGSIPSYHMPFLLGQPSKEDYFFSQTDSLEIVAIGNGCVEVERSKADVIIELEPRVPQPGLVDVWIQSNANNGQIVEGQLHSINVGIEDMFMKAIVPKDVPEVAVANYYLDLFDALWEACGASSSTGREAFVLKDGKGAAAINGTESVKLLEAPYMAVIQAVERCLTPFIVNVIGEPLTRIFRNGETMRDEVWKDFDIDVASEVSHPDSGLDKGPLYIEYTEGNEKETDLPKVRKNMGTFLILIFLPPRFHLLFKMEVCEVSTLARVRTDYWPCLAYVDELLESLFDGW